MRPLSESLLNLRSMPTTYLTGIAQSARSRTTPFSRRARHATPLELPLLHLHGRRVLRGYSDEDDLRLPSPYFKPSSLSTSRTPPPRLRRRTETEPPRRRPRSEAGPAGAAPREGTTLRLGCVQTVSRLRRRRERARRVVVWMVVFSFSFLSCRFAFPLAPLKTRSPSLLHRLTYLMT